MNKIIIMKKGLMSFLRDERGAVTIEWVVLTAGVIALGIAAYGAFKIDTENTTAVLLVNQDGSKPIMIGGNAISQLIARTKLEAMIFVSCIFKTGALQEDAMGNKFDVCS
jgi:Flp pilus assembly pilin Flp